MKSGTYAHVLEWGGIGDVPRNLEVVVSQQSLL